MSKIFKHSDCEDQKKVKKCKHSDCEDQKCRKCKKLRECHDEAVCMLKNDEVCMQKKYAEVMREDDAVVKQDANQFSFIDQESDEIIWIKDSCNITVQTTDTQAAVSLQVGLQLAIALVISITIGDSDRGQTVAQELLQKFDSEQTNKQKIYIDNSKDVNIITTDTDLTVNIQAMLQVLLALVVKLDVL